MTQELDVGAMAFYHEKGFIPAYRQAARFSGEKGHIGTMLDLVDARWSQLPIARLGYENISNPTPWGRYYTTLTAEYMGFSRGGTKILIVAHGVGPLSTLDGILTAYKWEFGDKERCRRGGRISAEEFLKLESGACGDVHVIDYEAYVARRKYPFGGYLLFSEAERDPLLLARLGPRAVEYIALNSRLAVQYHREQHGHIILDPYILSVEGAANCSYQYHPLEEGMAFAHLVSVGAVMNVGHQSKYNLDSWAYSVGLHEWWNGVRLVGVRGSARHGISDGPDAYRLLRRHWRNLLEPSGMTELPGGFFALMQMPDKTWFTQVDKAGEGMDMYEPEFQVTLIEPIGDPVQFSTDVRHYHGFFKYGKHEAKAAMPPEANAYMLVGEPENIYEGGNPVRQTCFAQPYRVVIDPTQRLIRKDALANNYELMMRLLAA